MPVLEEGGESSSVDRISITGGVIMAKGGANEAAGIGGGGHDGLLNNFSITGGWIQATVHYRYNAQGNGNANTIGGGCGKSSADLSNSTAIILDGTAQTATFYGTSATLTEDVALPDGYFLTINDGQTLTIASGATLTNNGTITNNGIIVNSRP